MLYSEYQALAEAFRQQLQNGDFPEDPDDWLSLEATVTCRTPGCPVQDAPRTARVYEQADGVYRVVCGGCSRIPEVVATFDDGPVTLLEAQPVDPPPGAGGGGEEEAPGPIEPGGGD